MQSDTTPKTWRDWLSLFQTTASAQGFADYMRAFDRLDSEAPPAALMATLYGYTVNARLMTTYLLAATQAPPDQVAGALEEIRRAARSVQFDRHAPKSLKREERELYAPITQQAASHVRELGDLLFDIFMRYVRDEVEPNTTADEIFREACRLSLSHDDKAAIRRMGAAGVLVLLGSPMWRGWPDEGSKTFRQRTLLLHSAFESCQHALPLLPIAEQRLRADEFAQQFGWPQPGAKERRSQQTALKGKDNVNPDQVMKLIQISRRDTPWTEEEIRASANEREQLIEHAKSILYSAVPLPDTLDAHIKGLAIRDLGILRCDDVEIMEHLISRIVQAEERADDFFDISKFINTIIQTLQWIGTPAVPVCLRFLRNSFHEEARLDVACALGVAGRGSDEVFQYLLDQFEQTSPKDGKARWAMPLALTHDERAIAPIARAFEATRDEPDQFMRESDAYDYLDALDEMGAITAFITPPEMSSTDEDEEDEDENEEPVWASVEVRGVGLLEGVAPADWIPLAERNEEEDDEVWDGRDLIVNDDGIDDLFIYEPPRPPAKLTAPVSTQPSANTPKVGRNDPCPCGSGKKYKHCCGRPQ
jgi:hypothetical protein